jgi:hypothetical protein
LNSIEKALQKHQDTEAQRKVQSSQTKPSVEPMPPESSIEKSQSSQKESKIHSQI